MKSLAGRVFLWNQNPPALGSPILQPKGDGKPAAPQLKRKAETFFVFLMEFRGTPSRKDPPLGMLVN